jgi:hypothetical protein
LFEDKQPGAVSVKLCCKRELLWDLSKINYVFYIIKHLFCYGYFKRRNNHAKKWPSLSLNYPNYFRFYLWCEIRTLQLIIARLYPTIPWLLIIRRWRLLVYCRSLTWMWIACLFFFMFLKKIYFPKIKNKHSCFE